MDNREALLRALDEGTWDVVLSDFSMPRFSVPKPWRWCSRRALDLPFVIVSATIGEEAAVEAMKAGAHDYILKHRLGRLVPAVKRELRESAMRRERRNLEEQLRHAQKLESLGLLAGGVAHDFNNLLTGILGNASLVLELTPPDAETGGMLRDIIRASERAADLTRQLLAYAGKGKFVIEPVDVSELVRDISELLRSSVPHTIELALHLGAGLPAVEADASQMQQLVMNLILNAVEATGERPGVVRVSTGVREIRPIGKPLALPSRFAAAGNLCLHRSERRRLRHERDREVADLRPVLHHQVHRPRPGPGGGAGDCARPQGRHPGGERGRPRQHLHRAAAGARLGRVRTPDQQAGGPGRPAAELRRLGADYRR